MGGALINSQIITWAKDRAGVTTDELSDKVNSKFELWENGVAKPTFKQAKELAKKLHIPFGYLFLKAPPNETDYSPDLRAKGVRGDNEYSLELKETLASVVQKQDWYRDFMLENGAGELEFVGKFTQSHSYKEVASDIEKTLKLFPSEHKGLNKNSYLKYLTSKAEEAGILVMRNGKVGANTHRTLDNEEFLGFALPDKIAPVVFINSADYAASQLFTLAHELAHIWVGAEGISNYNVAKFGKQSRVEVFCNKVAGEVLVNGNRLRELWDNDHSIMENTDLLVKDFKVSNIVIAIAALNQRLITRDEFSDFYREMRKIWINDKNKHKSGGDFHNSFPVANSTSLTNAILNRVYSGEMLIRDGAKLLGVKPKTIDNYAVKKGIK